ncbi:HAD-IC family P-type ATPase [Rubellimicrobium roseum]|uniref:HAD-IC family P-type ATPase n=1 Tax=Rubellimicrobium roseum TaxID=687525 RepID=UPI001C3F2C0D|nr:HAD-IC family P-type ATPase [Rubellimicrobium roseum]
MTLPEPDPPNPTLGLTSAEALRRLHAHGPNALPEPSREGVPGLLLATLREPMFLLLVVAALLYLLLGDLGEGLFLALGAAVSVGLVVFQQARSERALAALRQMAEPTARVLRDGAERRVRSHDLVPGDVVLVGEGERLPADSTLLAGDALTVDESALTGESVPVAKRLLGPEEAEADPEPGGDATPWLYSGTLVTRGQGVARVLRTGTGTRLGRIGLSLATIAPEPTRLQRTTARLIGWLGLLAFGFCGIVVLAYGALRGDWIEGALAGITLAIALLPEEFPMVLAIFLALGAWRLARQKVLARRSAVIEALGAATRLCVDKTGTLTENRMRLAGLWREGHGDVALPGPVPDAALSLLRHAALASAPRPVDPMDRAVREVAGDAEGTPLATHPLRPDRLAFVQAWNDGDDALVAAKGAPEAVLALCRLDPDCADALGAEVARLAARGLRVLAVASARVPAPEATQDPSGIPFAFEGLLAFEDPLRADVPEAVALARRAGIEVAMITGDYPATALAIARAAGIDTSAGVLTGAEVARLGPEALRDRVRTLRVYARIMPEQKLALVEAMKADGEVVAMTGDGVNDAPALEAAHIGIAMGQRGTDVAREAADLVLLDDRFASIVGGVRLGRRIFANLRKALTYVVAIHVPIAGLALVPILLGLPPVFFPMHVVLLELVIDPVCSVVFEAEPSERNAMERPPRPAREPLFGPRQLLLGVLQGAVILAAVLAIYVLALDSGLAGPVARGLAFSALVAANLALAFAESAEPGTRFFDPHRLLFFAIAAGAAAIVALILLVPPLAAIFEVTRPPLPALAVGVAVGVLSGGWWGLLRLARARPRRAAA